MYDVVGVQVLFLELDGSPIHLKEPVRPFFWPAYEAAQLLPMTMSSVNLAKYVILSISNAVNAALSSLLLS